MTVPKFYYFDNNATTPVAPEVVEAMLPFLSEWWANPSSGYQMAQHVAKQLEKARAQVAALINADPREVLFTSCGTESINTAIHSAILQQPKKRHILTTAVEHSATLRYVESLQRQGFEVTFLPVDSDGALNLALLEQSIRPETALVSVMWANNETGIIFPVEEIAAICRNKEVSFHTDAVQAAGKIPLDVQEARVDFLSLSGHKLHAPKGVGFLYVRRHVKFHPYHVAQIVGFGRAAELALANLGQEQQQVRALRDTFEAKILATLPGVSRNGPAEPRLPNTSNLAFEGVEAEALLIQLDLAGICASSGSACTTGSLEPSHVLKAMGMSAARARGSLRFSFGIYNTVAEVDYLISHLSAALAKLRSPQPDPSTEGSSG
jgi:cysteine desulfurase